ncbi:fimbria/pilus outer membrane usher protein, partial [Salmonella sp. s55044]|uniref:fimbria/pilus outer membrane usher protein n=1 Tax=Salmonella sp. s55044 TaxID=3159677 RepID=UPI00397F3276
LFDSYKIRGAQLESDERMLPESLRNYTPIVRGVADTNARVKITQRGQTIYETVVPPGAFEITDIGAMGYGGDLEMTITEADGRQRIQNIPFSAPPMLLHKSISRFAISA